MTQPTIAEVLHLAADEYLSPIEHLDDFFACRYSCESVELAAWDLFQDWEDKKIEFTEFFYPIMIGLRNMGVETHSATQFRSLPYKVHNPSDGCDNRQGARYAWLKFAALIAEEQGV